MAYNDRQDHAEAGGTGGGTSNGNKGGSSGSGKSSGSGTKEVYRDPDQGGQVTGYGAPVHTVMSGPAAGDRYARDPENWSHLQHAVADTKKATTDYENRDLFDRIVDFVAGPTYNAEVPDVTNPDTFHGGTYHTGTDIPGTIGMLAGIATGQLGAGMAAGQIGSMIGSELGIKDAMHAPATREESESYNYQGNEGLKAIAEKFAPSSAPAHVTGHDARGETAGTGAMQGGMLDAPSAAPVNTTGNPAVGGPSFQDTASPTGYLTPEQLWGKPGQAGNLIFDNETGQVRFVAA